MMWHLGRDRWRRARRDLMAWAGKTLPTVYGPRGMVLLGFALLCVTFGIDYVGVWEPPPTRPAALDLATSIVPIQLWGVAWFLSAFTLITAAFRVDQSKALGGVTALFLVWSISYFWAALVVDPANADRYVRGGVAFLSMVIACMGVAQMLNHGPTHQEVVEKPGAEDE